MKLSSLDNDEGKFSNHSSKFEIMARGNSILSFEKMNDPNNSAIINRIEFQTDKI
jgi:hypothetical protein